MRAGLLKEQITIWHATIEVNEFGEETTVWDQSYHTRARLQHNGGNRTNENDEIVYTSVKNFDIRWYVPISDFDRIEWNGHMYRILDITPDQDDRKQTVKCELINE